MATTYTSPSWDMSIVIDSNGYAWVKVTNKAFVRTGGSGVGEVKVWHIPFGHLSSFTQVLEAVRADWGPVLAASEKVVIRE